MGGIVRANIGAWSPQPDSCRFEWRVDGTLIREARGLSLKLTSSMRYKRITVTVIVKKVGYVDGRAASAPVTVS